MNIDHLTLLLSSLERGMPYYEHLLPLLGFVKKRDHVWSNSNGFFLQFSEAASGSRPYERYGAGMNHVGFSAETPQQVHAIRESMRSAGFEAPEIQHRRAQYTTGIRRKLWDFFRLFWSLQHFCVLSWRGSCLLSPLS